MPFWLMIVSMITAVLPVCRSPMISSRWPRPTGISASIAFRPVCIGSCTDLRGVMPGAFTSTRRCLAAVIGPLPSLGFPMPSTAQAGRGDLAHFTGHHVLQAEHAGDAVTHRQDLARFGDIGFGIERGDLLLQNLRDLGWADLHLTRLPSWRTANVAAGISNWCRTGGRRS